MTEHPNFKPRICGSQCETFFKAIRSCTTYGNTAVNFSLTKLLFCWCRKVDTNILLTASGTVDTIIYPRHYKVVFSVYNMTGMVNRCPSCPGEAALQEFPIEWTTEEVDHISYKKWTQADGTKLETISEEKGEFIKSLMKMISKLTKHHYVARCQSAHFALCKSEAEIGARDSTSKGSSFMSISFRVLF